MNPSWYLQPTKDVYLYFNTMADAIVCAREMAFDSMAILWDCGVYLLGEEDAILTSDDVYVE
jgi:hypothetical protein